MNNEWKMVPVVPTDEMEVAAENDYEQTGATFPRWKSAYAAMVAAAPTPPDAPLASMARAIFGDQIGGQMDAMAGATTDAPGTPPASAQDDAKDERQAFEAWFTRNDVTKDMATRAVRRGPGGDYVLMQTYTAWEVWQAARASALAAGDAQGWTLISDRLPEIPDGAPGKRIHILVGRYYEGRWFSWSLWYGPRGQDLRFYEEFVDEDADGDDTELTKDDGCATHWRYMPAGPAIAQQSVRKGE